MSLAQLRSGLVPRNTLIDFERLLIPGRWSETFVGSRASWVYDSDRTKQIHIGESESTFTEPWTERISHDTNHAYPVYLRIGETTIYELRFVSVDGGRIFVPVPEMRPLPNDDVEFYWRRGSLDFKVCGIIGRYYLADNLEGVAKRAGVMVVNYGA